jgi:FAD/FMN-containing dehydrogenase
LLEISDQESESHAMGVLEQLLAGAMEGGLATDAAVSSSLAQFAALWSLREDVSEAQAAEGPAIKHDISLPISRIPEFVESMDSSIAREFPGVRLVCFGHLGDGNLHYNVSPGEAYFVRERHDAFRALEGRINRAVHDAVAARRGSISAEHGLGVLRRDESARFKSDVELRLMRAIKNALDPHGLMNPGKVIA